MPRPSYGWEDNIKWIFKKYDTRGVQQIDLAQDRGKKEWDAVIVYLDFFPEEQEGTLTFLSEFVKGTQKKSVRC